MPKSHPFCIRFPDEVRDEAHDFLNMVRAETGGTRKIVGIHVRRDWDTLRQEGEGQLHPKFA